MECVCRASKKKRKSVSIEKVDLVIIGAWTGRTGAAADGRRKAKVVVLDADISPGAVVCRASMLPWRKRAGRSRPTG